MILQIRLINNIAANIKAGLCNNGFVTKYYLKGYE